MLTSAIAALVVLVALLNGILLLVAAQNRRAGAVLIATRIAPAVNLALVVAAFGCAATFRRWAGGRSVRVYQVLAIAVPLVAAVVVYGIVRIMVPNP